MKLMKIKNFQRFGKQSFPKLSKNEKVLEKPVFLKKRLLICLFAVILLYGCAQTTEQQLTQQQQIIQKQKEIGDLDAIAGKGVTKTEAESLAKDLMLMMQNELSPIVDTSMTNDGSWKITYKYRETEMYILIDSTTGEFKGSNANILPESDEPVTKKQEIEDSPALESSDSGEPEEVIEETEEIEQLEETPATEVPVEEEQTTNETTNS